MISAFRRLLRPMSSVKDIPTISASCLPNSKRHITPIRSMLRSKEWGEQIGTQCG